MGKQLNRMEKHEMAQTGESSAQLRDFGLLASARRHSIHNLPYSGRHKSDRMRSLNWRHRRIGRPGGEFRGETAGTSEERPPWTSHIYARARRARQVALGESIKKASIAVVGPLASAFIICEIKQQAR